METVIEVSNVSKEYRLGMVGTNSIVEDLNRYWAKLRGKEDPALKIGHTNILSEKQDGKRQEYVWALKDVSFTVNRGEVLGIIGKNGAGKSTLLKILSKVTSPTKGNIRLKGKVASLLEVGTGFHHDLTGRENIYLNGAILGMSKNDIKRKFDEIVEFSGVERFIDSPVKRYSSGMYVRLAFAVAAHLEPEIMIIDEVLAVGDAEFQLKCLGKMGEVAKGGRTVLFVSHNMAAMQRLCKSGILLKNGEIATQSNIENVINSYLGSQDESQSVFIIETPTNKEEMEGYLYKVEIQNSKGENCNEIPLGDDWKIIFHFSLNKTCEHFIIGMALMVMIEVPFQTSWSSPQKLEAGNYTVTFYSKDFLLAPGRYTIAVGISNYKRTIQYFNKVGTLTIAETGPVLLTSDRLVSTRGNGYLLNSLSFSIAKSSI